MPLEKGTVAADGRAGRHEHDDRHESDQCPLRATRMTNAAAAVSSAATALAPESRTLYFFVPVAQGFLAPHGFFAAHGFLAAHGLAAPPAADTGLTFIVVPLPKT